MRKLGTTATVILFTVCAVAVGAEWTVRYDGGHGYDGAAALALSPSGQVYAAGYQAGADGSEDVAVIRYEAANGDMVVGTYRYLEGDADFSDGAEALAVSDVGNIYVTGYSTDTVMEIDHEPGEPPETTLYYFQQVTTLKYNANLVQQSVAHVPEFRGHNKRLLTFAGGYGVRSRHLTLSYPSNFVCPAFHVNPHGGEGQCG